MRTRVFRQLYQHNKRYLRNKQFIKLTAATISFGGILSYYSWNNNTLDKVYADFFKSSEKKILKKKTKKQNNVIYTRNEVSKHNNMKDGIWVTYNNSVYDITDFIEQHPGGSDKILLAAGLDIQPFWQLYRVHLQLKEPMELLEQYKIGELDPQDIKNQQNQERSLNDPYKDEPKDRLNLLKKHTDTPFNAETPTVLIDDFITPNELWFCRHHHPVPLIKDIDEFSLTLENDDNLDLEKKKKKKKSYVLTTIQCAGNRRSEYNQIQKTQGLPWTNGAISTAVFAGIRLSDLIYQEYGLSYNDLLDNKSLQKNIKHVWFEGIDSPYDASIPIKKALDPLGDVIIAYEMNGVELPREHGYPLRVIVPGHLGARNVKWLSKIKLSLEESQSNWQRGIPYKGLPSNIKKIDSSIKKMAKNLVSVQELPVNSAFTKVLANFDDYTLELQGYAYSGGGRGIVRVDISIDNGKTWPYQADLRHPPTQDNLSGRKWAWSLFDLYIDDLPKELILNLKKNKKQLTVTCKAVDTSYNQQPENIESIWNIRGILNNSWHRVNVDTSK